MGESGYAEGTEMPGFADSLDRYATHDPSFGFRRTRIQSHRAGTTRRKDFADGALKLRAIF